MKATLAIAVNVFRESVRDKILYNLVLFAILMIGASYVIGQLTAGQDVKIIKDLGLAATTLGIRIAGHFSRELRNFHDVVESRVAQTIARGAYWVLPNLEPFDVKAQVVHGQHVTAGYVALVAAYGVVYIGILLVIATFVFSRRDFK